MYSSKYLTIVAEIRAVVVTTRADGGQWFCKDRDKPFIF